MKKEQTWILMGGEGQKNSSGSISNCPTTQKFIPFAGGMEGNILETSQEEERSYYEKLSLWSGDSEGMKLYVKKVMPLRKKRSRSIQKNINE